MQIRITNSFLGGLMLIAIGTVVMIFRPERSAPVSIATGALFAGLGILCWLASLWNWWQHRH